jgi:hypothetical protein
MASKEVCLSNTETLRKYLDLDQKGSITAEYVWIDADGGVRTKSRVSSDATLTTLLIVHRCRQYPLSSCTRAFVICTRFAIVASPPCRLPVPIRPSAYQPMTWLFWDQSKRVLIGFGGVGICQASVICEPLAGLPKLVCSARTQISGTDGGVVVGSLSTRRGQGRYTTAHDSPR